MWGWCEGYNRTRNILESVLFMIVDFIRYSFVIHNQNRVCAKRRDFWSLLTFLSENKINAKIPKPPVFLFYIEVTARRYPVRYCNPFTHEKIHHGVHTLVWGPAPVEHGTFLTIYFFEFFDFFEDFEVLLFREISRYFDRKFKVFFIFG